MSAPDQTPPRPAILLIVFNRPEQTRRVLERVLGFAPPRLYVAADGPRAAVPADAERCAATRALFTGANLPGVEVRTLFRETNLGCGRAVSGAIDWFFAQEERGIVLEDDCLPAPDLYAYMSWALERFASTPRVWHIAAMGLPFADERPGALIPLPFIWGWASWREKWAHYRFRLEDSPPAIAAAVRSAVATEEARDYWVAKITAAHAGAINTWDYQWVYAHWRHRARAFVPPRSFVENIGFGADATHTRSAQTGYAPLSQGTWTPPPAAWQAAEDPRLFSAVLRQIFGLGRNNFAYRLHRLGQQRLLVYLRLGIARRLRDLRLLSR